MIIPVYPKSVVFKFPTRWCNSLPTDNIPSVYTISTTPTQPGVALGTLVFDETALALFTASTSLTTPTNQSTLQNLLSQFVLDFLNWQMYQIDEVLAGIASIQPNGILQCIEFSYNQNECYTRLSSLPNWFPVDRLAHQISTLETDCPTISDENSATPCIKWYAPPIETQSGNTTKLDEFLICFQDGRLIETYLQTVTYNCGCGPVVDCCNVPCSPCPLPKQNLTISWINTILGNGLTTLFWNGSTSWISVCSNGLIYQLVCNAGHIELQVIYFTAGACPTGTRQYCSNLRASPFVLTLSSFTCNPFSLTFNSTLIGCPAVTASGFTSFTVTGTAIPEPNCCISVCIPNCVIATYTVTVVGIGSGIIKTTAGGPPNSCVVFNIGAPGVYTIEVTGNNIDYSQSYNISCCDIILIPIYCASFSAVGCHSLAAPGATIEINDNTYDLPVEICLDGSKAPYPYIISAPLFQTVTGNFSFSDPVAFPCSQGLQVTLTPINSYYCLCTGGACPAQSGVWTLTDSQYGDVAMTYDPIGQSWTGFRIGNYPGGPSQCGHPPACDPLLVPLMYIVSCSFGVPPGTLLILSVHYNAFGHGPFDICPTGVPGPIFNASCIIGTTSIENCPFEFELHVDGMGFPCGSCALYPTGANFVMTPP
jgi:hypothetical protein